MNDVSRSEWDRRVLASNAALQQDWSYGEAMKSLGADVKRLAVRDAGGLVALAQITRRRIAGLIDWGVCTRGPIWVSAADPQTRAAAARALLTQGPLRRPRALFLTPADTFGEAVPWTRAARLKRIMTGQCAAVLDLTPDADGMRASMRGKWRNRLRGAEKALAEGALKLARAGSKPAQYRWLLEREDVQREAVGYSALPTKLVEAYQAAKGGKSGVRAWRVDAGRDPVAGMLFLVHGDRATYHLGWTSAEGRDRGAHSLALWGAMQGLREEGVRSIDLGAVDTDRSAGLARFKLGAGARPTMLAGTFV